MEVHHSNAPMNHKLSVAQKPESTLVQTESTADISESAMLQINGSIYSCVRFRSKVEVSIAAHLSLCS